MKDDYGDLYNTLLGIRPKRTGLLSDLLDPFETPAVPTGAPYRGIRDLLREFNPAPVLPTPKPPGIDFEAAPGTRIKFSEPTRFYTVTVFGLSPILEGPGLYVMLVPDNSCKPREFRAIYFGQTKHLAERATDDHEHFNDWCNAAGGEGNLYVAYHWIYGSTKQQRTAVEKQLVDRYHPECNWPYNLLPFMSGIWK